MEWRHLKFDMECKMLMYTYMLFSLPANLDGIPELERAVNWRNM
jgi:hypothetical protein